MSSWINEAAIPNHNGNGFPQINDPSAVAGAMMDPSAFMGNPAQFNPQFANPQQIMPNGPMRNASPGFSNPMYQTNSVIPSKRPRPREDSIGQSPRQAPGMIPTSRAETPQQSQFPGFQQPGMQQQQAGQPSPYPHLQPNGSGNATPSPNMANQMRPGSVPQRVATTSPHPFSPAAQQFPQSSPIPSEHSGTPQPFMQQNNFQQGFNPQFNPGQSPARPSPTPNAMVGQMLPQQMNQMQQQMPQMAGQMAGQMPSQMAGQMPNQMFPQQMAQGRNAMEQQRMIYQMHMQQQAQRSNTNMQLQMAQQQAGAHQAQQQAQAQHQAQQQAQAQAQRNMMAARQGMPNGQMPPGAMRPQQGMPQQPMGRMLPPDQFMKNLMVFMNSKKMQVEPNPIVEGRPVNLFNLFQVVYHKLGGYRNTTQSNGWPQVSHVLGLPPTQIPSAPQQLKGIYERNLVHFEEHWKMRMQQQQQQQQQGGMPGGQNIQQSTPTKTIQNAQIQQPPQMMMPGGPQQGPMPSPAKPPGQHQASVNGFPAPHPAHGQPPMNAAQGHSRNSLSRSVQPTPTADEFSLASPAQSKAGTMSVPGSAHPESQGMQGEAAATMRFPAPFAADPEEYMPCSREISTYGGVDTKAIERVAEDLRHSKIDIPAPIELGMVDIHALTKSIQSGIHGEVRLALDTLASLTCADHYNHIPIPPIELEYCDDLVETLVECAEEQADLLAENSEEASNEVTIPLYEDVVRACRIERVSLRKIPLFGTPAYELEHAVDRLIGITTILRNLSDPAFHNNQKFLADETVIKFLCVIIRYLGTREMLVRTNANTLDLMKDVVMLLSNIAGEVVIPGREQASCLLQFLLAFAPSPVPAIVNDTLFFTPYDPALHPYLPYAVDALAKLLARDEPNRTYYTAIFAADAAVSSSPPCELLTRAFGLAISPIPPPGSLPLPNPKHPGDNRLADPYDPRPSNLPSLVEVRKPFLMQGLLAANIVASLAPGYESDVTRIWLACGNGFAQNLSALIRQLSVQFEGQPVRAGGGHPRNQPRRDGDLVYIVKLAVSLLRKLSEKARDPNNPTGPNSIPATALPGRDNLLGALQMQAAEWTKEGMLVDLLAYASLAD